MRPDIATETIDRRQTEVKQESTRQYSERTPQQPLQFGSLGHLLSPLNDREKIVIVMHRIFGMSASRIAANLVRCPRYCQWEKQVNGRRPANSISSRAVYGILNAASKKVFWNESLGAK